MCITTILIWILSFDWEIQQTSHREWVLNVPRKPVLCLHPSKTFARACLFFSTVSARQSVGANLRNEKWLAKLLIQRLHITFERSCVGSTIPVQNIMISSQEHFREQGVDSQVDIDHHYTKPENFGTYTTGWTLDFFLIELRLAWIAHSRVLDMAKAFTQPTAHLLLVRKVPLVLSKRLWRECVWNEMIFVETSLWYRLKCIGNKTWRVSIHRRSRVARFGSMLAIDLLRANSSWNPSQGRRLIILVCKIW